MYTIKESKPYQKIIQKSKFIAVFQNVETKEEIEAFIKKTKIDYPNATHYTYAYRMNNTEKAFDDKEPAKTAGLPILNVLKKNELNNIICIVVRYFGGIKLGTGGLVRAYTSTTVEALKENVLSPLIPALQIKLTLSYENWNSLQKKEVIKNIVWARYQEKVEVWVLIEKEKWETILSCITPLLETYTIEKETFL